MTDLNETLSESSPKWCLNDAPHGEHWAYNEFGGRDYCSGRPEPRRADLTETLAGIRREVHEWPGLSHAQEEALLSAVENVLALCDEYEAQARGDNPEDRLRQASRKAVALRFRAALQDAIGGGER